jgi:hypothetical protein
MSAMDAASDHHIALQGFGVSVAVTEQPFDFWAATQGDQRRDRVIRHALHPSAEYGERS